MPKGKTETPWIREERKEAIYKQYMDIIAKYGETARYISRGRLYEETARPFFISAARARNIIQEVMRKKKKEDVRK